MYLNKEEHLREVLDTRIIAKMARRLDVLNMDDFLNLCEFRVKSTMMKRYNEGRFFEDKTHCIRYIALIIYRRCTQEYYRDKHNNTHAFDESFFTGEFDDSNAGAQILDRSDVMASSVVDYSTAYDFIKDSIRAVFPKYAETYIKYRFYKEGKPPHSRVNERMNLFTRLKIKEYASGL
tara:strand:+ start:149 stop:682 length:534 start_codon:yes stop_codon:yes gene_type:complete